MDRIEHIKELIEKGAIKPQRRQSSIINNFYALITIVVVCLALIIYLNYLKPSIDQKKKLEEQKIQKEKYYEQRAKQIELSHKLNNTKPQEKQ